MSYEKVLVTGGAGFVGSHLVDELAKQGFEVTVLDNLSTGRLENLDLKNTGFVEGDVRDLDLVEEALRGVQAVFHLAAISSVAYSLEHPDVTYDVNVNGTRNLLEGCLRSRVKRFIYISTCAVYGEPEYLPIDERHPTKPVSPYAASKLEAELACGQFQENQGVPTTILRPFNVYGLRMRNDDYGGVIARFIESFCKGEPPIIYGDGEQTRDFIHVKDVIDASILALKSDHAVGRTFNIASGVPTSVNYLARLLVELSGVDWVKPQYLGARKGDIRHSYAETRQAKYRLGFKPRISLKEGLSTLLCGLNLLAEGSHSLRFSSFSSSLGR